MQFRIKWATDLLLTPDKEEPIEDEVESDSGRDACDDMRMDGRPHFAGHHHVITPPKK